MTMDLLLDRLGYRSPLQPDVRTLRGLHRAWRTRVPYENFDIQLGRPIRLEPEALLDKFGRRRRGGFCYEMNGTLALVLREAGFTFDLVDGAVMRETHGDEMWGNHVALLVDIDGERWLADTGIGDAFLDPVPLREGVYQQGALRYRLERLDRETWRLHHHEQGSVPSFDFHTEPRALPEFAGNCQHLASAPDSGFVRVLVAQHHQDDHELTLRGRTIARVGAESAGPRTIASSNEFAHILADTFRVPLDDLGPDGLATLWEKTAGQHAAWLELQARAASG
jgi:N-hydroxyarylamine O-acetyltransferase